MSQVPQADRVASRFLQAKGVSLLPDFKKAQEAFEKKDMDPMAKFGKTVLSLIFPTDRTTGDFGAPVPADWYLALGTAKRNAINALQKDVREFLDMRHGILNSDMFQSVWIRRFETWAKPLRTLEIASAATDEDRIIKRGPFEIVPMPGVPVSKIEGALKALDEATGKIQRVFPEVLYGKVHLSTHLNSKSAAWYTPSGDQFYVSVNAQSRFGDVHTIAHELGHRYQHRFLSAELTREFFDLSTRTVYEEVLFDKDLRNRMADEVVSLTKARGLGKPMVPMSPELVMWLKSPDGPREARQLTTEFLSGKIDEKELHEGIAGKKDVTLMTGKVLREPIAVTPYGATKWTENFAEAFAHLVLGMPLPNEIVEFMAKLK